MIGGGGAEEDAQRAPLWSACSAMVIGDDGVCHPLQEIRICTLQSWRHSHLRRRDNIAYRMRMAIHKLISYFTCYD